MIGARTPSEFGALVREAVGEIEGAVLAAEGRNSELFYFWPTYGFVEFGPADDAGFCEVIGTSWAFNR